MTSFSMRAIDRYHEKKMTRIKKDRKKENNRYDKKLNRISKVNRRLKKRIQDVNQLCDSLEIGNQKLRISNASDLKNHSQSYTGSLIIGFCLCYAQMLHLNKMEVIGSESFCMMNFCIMSTVFIMYIGIFMMSFVT